MNRASSWMVAALLVALLNGCATGPTLPPAPAVATLADTPDYRIGPGDTLSISVFGQPDLAQTIPVRPDGKISTQLVQEVVAAGKTAKELTELLEKEIGVYVRNAKVSVMVTGFVGGDRVRVVQQGQEAGARSLPYRANMTLLDMMIEVGGLAQYANGNKAKIVRVKDGKNMEYRVRLDDLLRKGDMSANVMMLPGDVIIIPESRF